MRESEHFVFFRDLVLPYLYKIVKDNDLRIWSAGCSSGEEPYTLAMIINDFFREEKMWWDTKILATDISRKVLGKAIKGVYTNDAIKTLPPTWKQNYFKKIGNDISEISDIIKKEVIIRKFNLMESLFPFKRKFHIIFCRNVMIYFDDKTRIDLVNKFYDNMEYGGYLFIGNSESLVGSNTKFTYIAPAIYRMV